MGIARTLSIAGLAALALALPIRAQESQENPSRQESKHAVGTTAVTILGAKSNARSQSDWRVILPVGGTWGATLEESATISFDKDVRVNGNRIAAGSYKIQAYRAGVEDLHFVFSHGPGVTDGASGGEGEMLRLAVVPSDAPPAGHARFGIDNIAEEEPHSADLYFHWGSRKATVRLVTTGLSRRSTPPPEIPGHAQAAWAVVRSSLDAFIAEDIANHIRDFAEDFETDFGDGGGPEAHAQLLSNIKRPGLLEEMVMDLEGLEWEIDGEAAEFKNIVIYSTLGRLTLSYTLDKIDNAWKITFLGSKNQS